MTLPAPLQFIIAMVAYAIRQRMARHLDYLQEEVHVLKEALAAATGKTRVHFSAEQRRRLALKGKELTAEERRACCQIVRPETILAWFRQLAAKKYDSSVTPPPPTFRWRIRFLNDFSGGGQIRTDGTLARSAVFKLSGGGCRGLH